MTKTLVPFDAAQSERVVPLHADDEADDNFLDGQILAEFISRFGNNWRYVHVWGQWLNWSGRHWRAEDTRLVNHLVTRTVSAMARQHGRKIVGSRVRVIEDLAQADRAVARRADDFDTTPMIFNAQHETLNLSDDSEHLHQRADNLTKIAGASPYGECPQWKEFLHQVTDGDAELQAYYQRMCGYFLTGVTTEHVFFFAHGTGANGKSTFVNVVSTVLGDYATTTPSETFMLSRLTRHPVELADLRGYRLVTSVEVSRGARWNESRLFMLTGGDRVKARFMYGNPFEYTPQFKLLVVGNHKPRLATVNEAIRRRLHLLPFTVTIPKDRRDPELTAKLLAERDGILRWMVVGCLDWRREGLNPPAAVRAATEDYLASQDAVGRWLEERCEVGKPFEATAKKLFADWKDWATACDEFVGSQRDFADQLEARGFRRHRTKKERCYLGLRLATAASSDLLGDAGDT